MNRDRGWDNREENKEEQWVREEENNGKVTERGWNKSASTYCGATLLQYLSMPFLKYSTASHLTFTSSMWLLKIFCRTKEKHARWMFIQLKCKHPGKLKDNLHKHASNLSHQVKISITMQLSLVLLWCFLTADTAVHNIPGAVAWLAVLLWALFKHVDFSRSFVTPLCHSASVMHFHKICCLQRQLILLNLVTLLLCAYTCRMCNSWYQNAGK